MVCLLGQKLGDNVVSLSQLNAVSTFSYGKIFHDTFLPKPRGVFCNILVILVVVPSQRPLSSFSRVLRPSQGAIWLNCLHPLLCFGECWGGWSEFKAPVSFPCELLVPVWGRWLETGFCSISGSDLLTRKGKTPESLLFWHILVIGRRSWWQLFKSKMVLFGLCKSIKFT